MTVAAVAEAGVVVMRADPRVHADAVDDLLRVQALALGVGVKLVEIADTHRQVRVGEELDRLSLGGMRNEDRDVGVGGALLEERGEHLGFGPLVLVRADDDAARVEVVVESLALAEEFGREDDIVDAVLLADGVGIPYGNGRFNDHQHVRVDAEDVLDGVLDGGGVEEMVLVVIIGRSGNDDELRGAVCRLLVHRGAKVQFAFAFLRFAEEALDLVVLDRADKVVQLICFLGSSGNCRYFMVLGKQHRQRQPHIPHTRYCNLHIVGIFDCLFIPFCRRRGS